MNAGDFLKQALPWIGAAATGGVPGLVAMAAKTVGDVLGTKLAPNADDIASAVQGASPEQLVALRTAELDFKARMQEAGYKHVEEMGRQALQRDTLYVADTADARKVHGANAGVFWLAIAILVSFAACVVTVLIGSFALLSGAKSFSGIDPGVIATVAGLIGTIVGYLAANAQQVVSYFFGSSQGSKNSGDAVRQSLQETLKKLGDRSA